MKCLDCYRMKLVIVGFMAALVIVDGERASAEFILGEPVNLGSSLNSSYADLTPSVSSDGLEIYFWSNRPGGRGSWDLWSSTRPSSEDQWPPATNLGSKINSSGIEALPCISADGLELYFSRGAESTGELMVSRRNNRTAAWGTAQNLGSVVNRSGRDDSPKLTSDGLELYFISTRAGGRGLADIWVATRPTITGAWRSPVNLSIVNSSAYDQWVNISGDGLTLLFQSTRSGGVYGGLYMSKRKSGDDPWTVPVYLGLSMDGSVYTLLSSISNDGTMLYLSDHINYAPRAGGSGSADMWQVPVVPIIDFTGDGIVNSGDMCLIVDHWHTDEPLYDIAPSPFGDGKVDVQDLIVLSEHLFEEVNDPTLIVHWALDEAEGIIAYDSAGVNDAVVVGGTEWQLSGGQVDGALQLDGVDDYVLTGFVMNPEEGPFSVLSWIKGGAPGQAVLSQMGGASWLCADASDGNLMTELKGSGGDPLLSSTVITDGEWHRIGLIWDGSNRTLCVDGVVVAEDTQDSLESSSNGLYIGTGKAMESGTYFSGLIDDVRIYNREVKP